jgi:hypothetical protein
MAEVRAVEVGNAEKLGYLGLGMMGFPMARRLATPGTM